jgi:hypothetical protein
VAVTFNQEGGERLYGKADFEIPFPPECMRPIFPNNFYNNRLRIENEQR